MQAPQKPSRSRPALYLLLTAGTLVAVFLVYAPIRQTRRSHADAQSQANDNSRTDQPPPYNPYFEREAQAGNYTIRGHKESSALGRGFFEVVRDGEQVYSEDSEIGYYIFNTGQPKNEYDDSIKLPLPGQDVTGDGIPDLVVERWSGGAHCCCRVSIFSIGPEFKKIADIGEDGAFDDVGGENSGYLFKDLNGDGVPELVGNDWTFAYWWTSFSQSPAPRFILRYDGTKYVLATDLMIGQPPKQSEIDERIRALRQSDLWAEDRVPPELWGVMLDLIYAGRGDAAWAIFHKNWHGSAALKEEFVREFKKQLAESTLWPDIKAMNHWE
jgi:hypothetical protein